MRAQRYTHTHANKKKKKEEEVEQSARNTSTMGRFSCDSPPPPSQKIKKKCQWSERQLAVRTARCLHSSLPPLPGISLWVRTIAGITAAKCN